MLVLASTSDLLKVQITHPTWADEACPAFASWRDVTTSAYTPGRSVASLAENTTTTLVASPAASTYRVIDFLRITNPTPGPVTANILLDNGTNAYPVWVGEIPANGSVEYTDDAGFRVVNSGQQILRHGVLDLSSVAYDTMHEFHLTSIVTNQGDGDYTGPSELQILLPDDALYYMSGALNLYAANTAATLVISSFVSPGHLPFAGATPGRGFGAGAIWGPTSTTAVQKSYSSSISLGNTTSIPAASREGACLQTFALTGALPKASAGESRRQLIFSFYASNSTYPVSLLPGSVIFIALAAYGG